MDRLIPILPESARPTFIDAVRSFLTAGPNGGPVRWRHRGRNYRGIDCIGLPIHGLRALGLVAQDSADYSAMPDGVMLQEALQTHLGAPIPMTAAKPADVVLMRWYERDAEVFFNHVGILTPYPLGGFALLHAYAEPRRSNIPGVRPHGVVTEHRLGDPWVRRIGLVYSLTGSA